MISVKDAVAATLSYIDNFGAVFPSIGLRLEETEIDENTQDWLVTLSFLENPLTDRRYYKRFRVDGVSGQVKAMKNRSIAAPR